MRNAHVDSAILNFNQRGLFLHVSDKLGIRYINLHAFLDDVVDHLDPIDREHALYIIFSVEISAGAATHKIIINGHVYRSKGWEQLAFQDLRLVFMIVVITLRLRHEHIRLAF